MPWVQAVQPDKGDDVFDEEADDLSLLQQEWKTTMEKRVKEGYRDGMDAGKADALQQGFNNGYKEGMALMMTCGTLKGSLWFGPFAVELAGRSCEKPEGVFHANPWGFCIQMARTRPLLLDPVPGGGPVQEDHLGL
ncbi:protein YAE1 homolog isoform X2 [Ambystoma mexicanum]|uniref:protein YAE1 homolog isoform X2 n=1 Tax=Ambystoma mexicanum TaxID=8296 RepID=UPI0037E8751D